MKLLRKKIESIMYKRDTTGFFFVGSFLYLLAIIYKTLIYTRLGLYRIKFFRSEKLPCKVISIGNISVGGTGKTPMTIYMSKVLYQMGYTVSVISRGYGGKMEKAGCIVSDGQAILVSPDMAGDEPYMMAKTLLKFNIPVIIGKVRYKASQIAIKKYQPDIILLDDGFQHLNLSRDIDLVLMDRKKPIGNGQLLPRGILREPLSSLSRGSAFIFTRCNQIKNNSNTSLKNLEEYIKDKPVFFSKHIPYIHNIIWTNKKDDPNNQKVTKTYDLDLLKSGQVILFSGIANNSDFNKTASNLTSKVLAHLEFDDHYQYKDKDFKHIQKVADEKNVDYILTTEKDFSRIKKKVTWATNLVVMGVKISFGEDEINFHKYIKRELSP